MFKKKESGTVIVDRGTRKKKKIWKIVAVILVLLIIARIVMVSVFGGKEDVAVMVDTAPVTRGSVTSTLDTSGTIASETTKVYSSPVSANVGSIPVELGQNVKKGEYLLTYNTESLEKSYNIAELQAKAEQATAADALAKSNENSGDMSASTNDINTLQGQVDTLNAELSSLRAQSTQTEIEGNNNSAVTAEITQLKAELEAVTAQLAELEAKVTQETITDKDKEKISKLKEKKKSLESSIEKKEKKLSDAKDLANNATNIQAQIQEKSNQLADAQSKLAEAQGKKSTAEAGVLTSQGKANLDYSQKASKLTLEQTADNLATAKAGVIADFDGIVVGIETAEGAAAVEGAPLLTLASSTEMCVEVPVSKYNLENLQIDQKAEITFQDKTYQGTVNYVSKIAKVSEAGAAMVTVKVHIDNPDDSLIIGLDAKISVKLGTVDGALLVPVTSVNSDTKGEFVYTVENGIVVKKYVTTGMASKEMIEIKTGLDEKEKVITSVDSSIIEGIQVTENTVSDTETKTPSEGTAAVAPAVEVK